MDSVRAATLRKELSGIRTAPSGPKALGDPALRHAPPIPRLVMLRQTFETLRNRLCDKHLSCEAGIGWVSGTEFATGSSPWRKSGAPANRSRRCSPRSPHRSIRVGAVRKAYTNSGHGFRVPSAWSSRQHCVIARQRVPQRVSEGRQLCERRHNNSRAGHVPASDGAVARNRSRWQ
jgi:hypothetical protein